MEREEIKEYIKEMVKLAILELEEEKRKHWTIYMPAISTIITVGILIYITFFK